MRFYKIHYFNMFCSVLCFIGAVYMFNDGQIATALFDLFASLLNAGVVFWAISSEWNVNKRIQDKYRFTCKHCGTSFVPSFWKWFLVPHLGSKRFLKCNSCGKRSYMKRK